MATTTWQNEYKLGGGMSYNDANINYNQSSLTINGETFDLYYNTTGLATSWSNESK